MFRGFRFEFKACLLVLCERYGEGVGIILENNAAAQVELTASLSYPLTLGDDVYRRSLNG